ncbi:hypothetical protein K458DRAFT_387988 [Lentithecium fluviatile CBS 122367]|uniref:Uncharacterized protein n=1 Tax=Lentithecium fluviatile CBS 122367 TaxID=1168545 RepID=A0A6G1J4D5_9PLEO|nr:hypothetical protein K458DRAFT_387988 [Lentithecium fluviatile CBS 122367]
MGLAFALQRFEAFFAGGPPKDPEDYFKHYIMALRASSANFRATKVNSKEISHQLFVSSAGQTLSRTWLRFSLLQSARDIDKSKWQCEMDDNDMPAELVKDSDIKPKKAHNKKLPLPNLLALLRAVVQAEVMEVSYDYLTLHRFCWRLLRAVNDRCRDRLVKLYGPDYTEEEYQLPFIMKQTEEVTSALLMEAKAVQGMLM